MMAIMKMTVFLMIMMFFGVAMLLVLITILVMVMMTGAENADAIANNDDIAADAI